MIDVPKYLLENKNPFFVCSKSVLKEQVKKLKSLGVEVFYSTKTNPEAIILKELGSLGVGFSVSSQSEFLTAVSEGADANKVIYYERGLTEERVKWLIQSGCKIFAVDSVPAFENVFTRASEGFAIIIRIKSEKVENAYSGKYIAGVSLDVTKELIAKCKEKKISTGILHHSSSQVDKASSWEKKFNLLSKLPEVDILDIGGGIPVEYNDENHDAVMEEIRKGVKKIKAKRIIAEPGRFIVGPACSLIAKVDLINGENAVLNCSVYNVHIDTIIADLILPCRALGKGESKEYRLLGSSLCNLDVFNPKVTLHELKVGDSVIFDKAGAYNFSSDFSSGTGLETHMID